MNLPFDCLTQEQARELVKLAREVTKSPFGPAMFLYLGDAYLAHEARGDAGEFRVSRTQVLEFLNNEISRAALRKLLLGFEEKKLVDLDGRYIGVRKTFTSKITGSTAGAFTPVPEQNENYDAVPRQMPKAVSESPKASHDVNGRAKEASVIGVSGQNSPWDSEEQYALNTAVETIAYRFCASKELVLYTLEGACAAPPQRFLAAVCGVASAIRASLTVEDYVVEVRDICTGKSSLPAANPKTFARVHQAFTDALADNIKREQEKKRAEEQVALGNWFLGELNKHMEAQAQTANAANAKPAAVVSPATESVGAAVTSTVQPAPADSAALQAGASPVDASMPQAGDNIKPAEVTQLPPGSDWFMADWWKRVQAATQAPAKLNVDTAFADPGAALLRAAESALVANSDPVGVAPPESSVTSPLNSVPANAMAPDESDAVKLAKIYQLPQPDDWFWAA